jgi:Phospholipase_D-nuclease N-terminal
MDLMTPSIIIALTVPFFIATVWAVVNVAQKDFGSLGKKVTWAIVSMIPFVGFLIYLIFGFRKGTIPGE